MANRVQNGTSVQGQQVQSHVGFFRKMRRSLTRRGTRRSRSESPTPTGRNLVCVDIPALDSDSARSYVGHTVSRSRDLVAKKNCRASAVPFRPRIAPLVKTEDLEPDFPNLLYAQRNGIGPIVMGKDICDDIPIPKLVKGDPQLRHCVDMDENANKASQKKMSPEQEIQELILDIDRDFAEYEKQGARPKTRSVPQLYHADELGTLHIQTVTCEPVIISQKTDMLKSADDDETDDEYDDNGDLKAYCVSYKMPDQESPESVTIKQEQLISEMKPKTPSEDEDDGDDDAGVYLEAHKYTESDTLDTLPNGTVSKDDAIIAIQGDLLTDSSKSMSGGSDEENCKTPRGSGNMEPLIITMATEIESYDSKTMQHESRTPHIAEVLRRHSFPDALDLKDIVLSQETKEDCRKTSPGDRLSQKSISPGKEEFEEVMLLKDNQLVNHSPTSHSSMETDLDACKRKSQDDIKSFCLRSSSSSSSTHSAHSIHSNHSTHSSLSSHSAHSAHGDAMDVNNPNGMPPAVDRSTKPRYMVEASTISPDYAEGMGAEGVDAPPPLPPRDQRNLENLPDENNISRMLMNYDQNYSDDDSDSEPTHVRLEDVLGEDFFKDLKQKNEMRSRSLPRQPMRDHHSPLRKQRGGSVKNRLSSFFRMPRGRKRHSTLGFPDRPLPDVPPARGAAQRFATQPRPHSYVAANVRQPMPSPPTRPPGLDVNGLMNGGTIARPQSREELEKTRGEFATSLRRISEYGWYWGPMSWDDAEMRLENMPDGSFLVRDSSDDRHILSLSFRAQGSTHHTRIEHHNGKFSFWSQPSSHGSSSIVEFIEEAMQHSRNGRFLYFLRPRVPGFPPAPVQLLFPISRFQKARSLQHMCRFVIRRQVRLDHIDELPLPRRLRDYLKEGQYYTPDDIVH